MKLLGRKDYIEIDGSQIARDHLWPQFRAWRRLFWSFHPMIARARWKRLNGASWLLHWTMVVLRWPRGRGSL